MLAKENIQNIYTLSPLQEGMYFHSLYNDDNAYQEQVSYRVRTDLDIQCVEKSLNDLIAGHDILRTVFISKSEKILQVVLKKRDIKIYFKDISGTQGVDEFLSNYKQTVRNEKFDLGVDLLLKVAVIKCSDNEFEIIWTFHHILMDGWCMGLLNIEFLEIYFANIQNKPLKRESVGQFGVYIKWLEKQNKDKALEFWRNYLSGFDRLSTVPVLMNDNTNSEIYDPCTYKLKLDENSSKELFGIALNNQATISTVFQAIWAVLLSKYNNCNDIVFGTVVSGRPPEIIDVEKIIGLFINTIPQRIKINGSDTFIELLKQVHSDTISCKPYHYSSLAEIQRESGLPDGLFDNILVFENYPIYQELDSVMQNNAGGRDFKVVNFDLIEQTNYHINLSVIPGDTITLQFDFNKNKYGSDTILKVAEHFQQCVNEIVNYRDKKIKEISILSIDEKEKVLNSFNSNYKLINTEKTVINLFQEQVDKHPDRISTIINQNYFTYKEIDKRSDSLAFYLRDKGVTRNTIVGIYLDRSQDVIISILGILKAGGAFLTIDSTYPSDKTKYIIKDSNTKYLISHQSLTPGINSAISDIIYLDQISEHENNQKLEVINTPDDLAYIIYTSGSTGQPKGVMIDHAQLMSVTNAWTVGYHLNEFEIKLLQIASFSFDVFVGDISRSLFNGGCMVICDSEQRMDLILLQNLFIKHNISIVESTPSLLIPLMDYIYDAKTKIKALKLLIIGSDVCNSTEFSRLKSRYGNSFRIINSYGTTETTIDSSFYENSSTDSPKGMLKAGTVPIGIPMQNTKYYILDNNQSSVPIGVLGDLYIAGNGVGRGYLNKIELSDEKFNFYLNDNQRLYKTGDVAKWLPDGNVDFIGRIDNQVKIRGFRVELGEIESAILKYSGIEKAIVLVNEDANKTKYLCAYIKHKNIINQSALLSFLKGMLPNYMLPALFIKIDDVPLTANSKIDINALPKPQIVNNNVIEKAKNETEQKLISIWSEVLLIDIDRIGRNSDFFELGGHSLKVILLIAKIYKQFEVKIIVKEVFENPLLSGLADIINKNDKKKYISINKAVAKEFYKLSSAQKRLYLLQQLDLDSTAYNMPNFLPLEPGMNISKIQEVFNQLMMRHETFRTSIEMVGEEPMQRIHDNVELKIQEIHIEKGEEQVTKNKFIQAFDLSKVPMLRVALVEVQGAGSHLMIDMHHVICDGISHDILEQEFRALCSGKTLPPLKLQYKDYSEWQCSDEHKEWEKKQESYWLKKFEGEIPVLNLPTDFIRPAIQSYDGANVNFTLSKEETASIKSLAKERGLTNYMAVLSAFTILLSKLSGQEDIILGSPIVGRNHIDLERIVGMFVNTLALRNEVKGDTTIRAFLENVKQTAIESFDNSDYQFEDLVEKVSVRRDMSRNPVFVVIFTMINQEEYSENLSYIIEKEFKHTPGISKFDLNLTTVDFGSQILMNIEYCTKLFKAESIDRYIGYLKRIIKGISENIDQPISAIEMLSVEEKHQLLYDFNDTTTNYPIDKSIKLLVEEISAKFPDNIALSYGQTQISYKEFNNRSNQLARQIIAKGIQKGDVVGLIAERSELLIIAIFGIIKAGATYLPISFDWPEDRIQFLLSDTGCSLMLYEKGLVELNDFNADTLDITTPDLFEGESENIEFSVEASNPIYIIYTSGTTGVPKGVLTTHSNVTRVVLDNQYLSLGSSDKILQLSSYTFDGSVFDIYGALLNGGNLVVVGSNDILEVDLLLNIISKKQVSVFFLTTALFNTLVDYGIDRLKDVKKILFGGERISKQHATLALKELGKGKLVHVYGPTETTVYASYHNVDEIDNERETIPIGKPLSNTTIYLLDKSRKLVAKGTSGEVYIGGTGNAKGYLNRVELSNEKFIINPYKEGDILYKTGDLARMLQDGSIEFMGRIDHQVKIRGYRIELGEIEAHLLRYSGIDEVCVVLYENIDDKYICAYYIAKTDIDFNELKSFLSKSIPAYMIPSYFVKLDKFPLNENGKINKSELPQPSNESINHAEFIAPKDGIERDVADVWEDVLKRSSIGVNENFFDVGGNSLKIIELKSKLCKKLNIEITVVELFENATISSFTSSLNKKRKKGDEDQFKDTGKIINETIDMFENIISN